MDMQSWKKCCLFQTRRAVKCHSWNERQTTSSISNTRRQRCRLVSHIWSRRSRDYGRSTRRYRSATIRPLPGILRHSTQLTVDLYLLLPMDLCPIRSLRSKVKSHREKIRGVHQSMDINSSPHYIGLNLPWFVCFCVAFYSRIPFQYFFLIFCGLGLVEKKGNICIWRNVGRVLGAGDSYSAGTQLGPVLPPQSLDPVRTRDSKPWAGQTK